MPASRSSTRRAADGTRRAATSSGRGACASSRSWPSRFPGPTGSGTWSWSARPAAGSCCQPGPVTPTRVTPWPCRGPRFDAACRAAAGKAGALEIAGRVAHAQPGGVTLDSGRVIHADVVIGADGAHSATAESSRLVDSHRALWGFAVRTYAEVDVARPVIALWDDRPGSGFPGYGWLFPGPDGANLGLGIGIGRSGHPAPRAQQQFDAFCRQLVRVGILERAVDVSGRRLGGWLKMGLVGTRPAEGRVLLVGDAAGLVNPLQGEGIAPALLSGEAAATAVLADPARPAEHYRRWMRATYASWSATAGSFHAGVVDRPRRISTVAARVDHTRRRADHRLHVGALLERSRGGSTP